MQWLRRAINPLYRWVMKQANLDLEIQMKEKEITILEKKTENKLQSKE